MHVSNLMRWMVGAIGMIVAVTSAAAQPSSQFLAEFQAGTDAYRLGQYAEARAHLERAMAIEPSLPGPPRFLAAVDAAESKWADCVAHARTAITANPASSEIAATRKLHDDCRAALDRPAFTGDYADGGALAVLTNISGAVITIGGLRAGASPLPPRPLALGTVEVTASKSGWKTASGTAIILPGVVTDLELVLAEDPTALTVEGDPATPTQGWVRVDAPAGAQIVFGGAALAQDERGRYQLPAGEHELEVTAVGYLPYRRRVKVERGQEQVIVVPRESIAGRAARRQKGTIAIGAAAGLAVVGAVTGWMAFGAADDARDWAEIERLRPVTVPLSETLAQAPLHTRAEIEARADRSRTLAIVSGVSVVASLAALGAGIYFLSRLPTDAPVEIGPTIGDGWGVSIRGAL